MASVDVAIPNYNYGSYLRACVESVLSQNMPDLRILIIDNASTDGSQDIARQLASSQPRVELRLRPKNLGPHASFNEAIDWAAADYFVILCSDDLLAPGALQRAVEIMDQHPDVHLTYGRTQFISADDPAIAIEGASQQNRWRYIGGKEFLQTFCRTARSPLNGPIAVVRSAVQKEIGYYRESLPHTDDVEMWMRFSTAGAVAEIDAVQAIVRIHGANRSAVITNVHEWNLEIEAAFEAFFANTGTSLPNARRLERQARRSLSARAYWSALAHIARRETGASDLLRFAVSRCPNVALVPPVDHLLRRMFF